MKDQVNRPRRPRHRPCAPLWQCLQEHFDRFLDAYEERYQSRFGFLRPIIPEVVNKFLDCGDLERGFARVRCDHCKHEYLLAFSCIRLRQGYGGQEGRWFCPSCHQKKVQIFGALLSETILFPVPHRHFTFGIPKLLRPYFRYDRSLLKALCRIAHDSLLDYMRTVLRMPEGIPGVVMTIHTFGEYLDFHPHLHALVADGLFARSGLFYCLPNVSLKPLEEMFRARVITFLVDKGLLPSARADMLRGWVHSGFNVHRSRRVLPDEREDLERLAQYIIGLRPAGYAPTRPQPLCRRKDAGHGAQPRQPRRIHHLPLQHEPQDSAQLRGLQSVRLHPPSLRELRRTSRGQGWLARRSLGGVGYSNKMRGQRDKQAAAAAVQPDGKAAAVIDVSEHKPRRIPSKKWRELINPPSPRLRRTFGKVCPYAPMSAVASA